MAKLFTWSEMKTRVLNDLDLVGEDFVTPAELLGYANEAIDEAEQEILNLGLADYFLDSEVLPLVADTAEYALPTDIWAHKIRAILYQQGNAKRYEIRRFKKLSDVNDVFSTDEDFRYIITNRLGTGPRIKFYPTPRVSEADSVTIWFQRNAREITADTDVVDVPEAAKFIIQHIKLRVYEKEGHPNQDKAIADLERERKLLQDTLATMVPDENNELVGDFSHYDEFDHAFNFYRRIQSSGSSV